MSLNIQNKPHLTTLDELCEGLSPEGKYSHLQVFLYRIVSNHRIGQEYLYVSRNAFGKVKLTDISYHENLIKLRLQDCVTGASSQFALDVNDKEFRFVLVAWEDITFMSNAENNIFESDRRGEL